MEPHCALPSSTLVTPLLSSRCETPPSGMNVPNPWLLRSTKVNGGREGREREREMFVLSTGTRALSQREPPQSFLDPLPSFLSFDRETPTFPLFLFLLLLLLLPPPLFPSLASIEKLAAAPHFYLIGKRKVKRASTVYTGCWYIFVERSDFRDRSEKVCTKISRIRVTSDLVSIDNFYYSFQKINFHVNTLYTPDRG